MSKYVHGRVRLATASPRVGEYDYATKEYSPSDYYGDHFMYRDDPNLLPVRKGMMASYSPYPSQNALTAFPPPMLVDRHGSAYNNWSPTKSINSSYLSGTYLGEMHHGEISDEEAMEIAEALAEEQPNLDPEQDEYTIGDALVDFGQGVVDAWNDLSPEQQSELIELGIDYAFDGDAQDAANIAGILAVSQLSDKDLKDIYIRNKKDLSPYSKRVLGEENYYRLRRALIAEMFKRGFLTVKVSATKRFISRNFKLEDATKPNWCKFAPMHPSCQKGGSSGGKGGASNTALILGVGAVALLAAILID